MAYNNLFASVSGTEVARLREDASVLLRPSKISGVSHLLATWVEVQPLGKLLQRALDGGDVIRPELWHPFRPPLVHDPAVVAELAEQVAVAVATGTFADDDWLQMGGRPVVTFVPACLGIWRMCGQRLRYAG